MNPTYPNPHNPTCPWYGMAEKFGAPNIKWCEETLCQWISEPANTWSNFSYMIVAIYVFYLIKMNKESKTLTTYSYAIFLMGLGSFIYHLSNFYLTQVLDFIGMYLFVGWCVGANFIRLKWLEQSKLPLFIVFFSLIFTLILHLMYITDFKFQMLILVAAIIIVITEYLARHMQKISYKNFSIALGLLIIAFSFSISDNRRLFCDPTDHLIQGHALWHLFSGVAMLFVYFHYRQINALNKDQA